MRRAIPGLLAALVVSVIAAASACFPYQTSDTPICGDRLLPQGDACVLWPAACGYCNADQRCGFDGNVTACVTPGNQGVDAPCSSDLQCAEGTICDGTRCRLACFESLDCGTDDAVACLAVYDTNQTHVASICHRDCDPTSPGAPIDPRLETCLPNEACHIPSNVEPSCDAVVGKGAAGATCKSDEDCASGFGCVTTNAGLRCERYCWVESPGACGSNGKCSALAYSNQTFSGTNLVLVGAYTLGVCQ